MSGQTSASSTDLKRLKKAVEVAVIKSRTPPEEGMTSWPFTFPQQHFTRDDWTVAYRVLRRIRTEHRVVYKKFLYERTVIDLIVDHLATVKRTPSMTSLVSGLDRKAAEETKWLVEVPLFNLRPPAETVPLGPDAMLVAADDRRDRNRWRDPFDDPWAVRRHLGDELTGRSRWLLANRANDSDLDTRQTASLLLVEEGTRELAISVAETRARYALAMWCLLAPPKRTARSRPVWPGAGPWGPAPHVHLGAIHKPFKPGQFPSGSRQGATIMFHGLYRLTPNPVYLEAPFDALRRANGGNQCALALLSAARSLFVAASFPSDLERTERIMHLWAAREALSDRGRTGQGRADDRWDQLVKNLRLRAALSRRGYDRTDVDEALEALHSLRDLATHKADDVLVNLDFPDRHTVRLNRGEVTASDASLSMIAANLPILYTTVRTAALSLTRSAIANKWNERAFHRRFQ
jgi:hypothetical protein